MSPAQRQRLGVLCLALGLALAAWAALDALDPRPWVALIGAAGPLIIPGGPAALLLWHGRGGRDPLDVSHRYR